jgi:fructokinase
MHGKHPANYQRGGAMIVVCGEALVDMVPGQCGEEPGYVPRPGGSPYNVAIGLARLGAPTGFLGRLSSDRFGRLLRGHLEQNGVDLRYVVNGVEHTTLAFVHAGQGQDVEYDFYTENSADRNLRPADLPTALAPKVEALHFGSFSLALEPGASTLAALMSREQGKRLITLDPNVRQRIVGDLNSYRRRLEGWVATVDLVKASAADLAWLYPDLAPERVAEEWLQRGPALVVVTHGGEGSAAYGRRTSAAAKAPRVEVVDTVGAGDSFMSGAVAWLHHHGRLDPNGLDELSGPELKEMLLYAGRASALTCTRAGADPPTEAELAAFPDAAV